MFNRPNNPHSASGAKGAGANAPTPPKKSVPSVISADMNILGNIMCDGIIDFDGAIDGNIRCGTLVLRHNGKINGEVHADTVQIYGRIKGLIKAKMVHLHATCSVEGIIMHESISIEDGANIDGKIKRTNKALPSPTAFTLDDADESEESSGGERPKILDNIRLISG